MTEDSGAWLPFDDGESIGQRGSEGGIILRDDEYRGGARITLERDGVAPFAITCAVYGWMVHTRFFSALPDAEREYALMQPELAAIVDLAPLTSDPDVDAKVDAVTAAIGRFVDEFPSQARRPVRSRPSAAVAPAPGHRATAAASPSTGGGRSRRGRRAPPGRIPPGARRTAPV
jgi:hypothetical protein